MYHPIMPMVAYQTVETFNSSCYGQRPNDDRERLWLLVKYYQDGLLHTCEGRVILSRARDFCGGTYMSSPQVNVYREREPTWDGYITPFTNNGRTPFDTSWERLKREPSLLPSLNLILHKVNVTTHDATQWMYTQLAAGVASHCIYSHRRMLLACDQELGECNKVLSRLLELSDSRTPTWQMPANLHGDSWQSIRAFTPQRLCEWRADGLPSEPFVNYNSSRWCNTWSLTLTFNKHQCGSDEWFCWACNTWMYNNEPRCVDCDRSQEDIEFSEELGYITPAMLPYYSRGEYLALISRHFWRNG